MGMEAAVETTTIEKVMEAVDETTTTEKAMEAVDEAATTEKVMEAVDETTTTEKAMEVVDEAATTEKVMEAAVETTTIEKVMEAVDETTTTEKAMEAVDETTTLKEMLTTVEVLAISESDEDMTMVTTLRPRLDEDAFSDTTTVEPIQDEGPDEMFLCQPVQSGDHEKSVMLLIPRDVIGDRINRLFDKNVKIVVRDFMLMDRSPRRL